MQTIQKILQEKKLDQHIPCGCSMSTVWAFYHKENKHTLYHEKYFMKTFCESLTKHTKSIIDFEKKYTVNKRKTKIASRCKIILHLWKKDL